MNGSEYVTPGFSFPRKPGTAYHLKPDRTYYLYLLVDPTDPLLYCDITNTEHPTNAWAYTYEFPSQQKAQDWADQNYRRGIPPDPLNSDLRSYPYIDKVVPPSETKANFRDDAKIREALENFRSKHHAQPDGTLERPNAGA